MVIIVAVAAAATQKLFQMTLSSCTSPQRAPVTVTCFTNQTPNVHPRSPRPTFTANKSRVTWRIRYSPASLSSAPLGWIFSPAT